MRKFYFLLLLLSGIGLLSVSAQDAANFTIVIGTNNSVHFNNTSTTTGDAIRKGVWTFGDGQSATTGAKEGTEHLYATAGTYTVCLKIYKKVNDEFSLTSQECKQLIIPAVAVASCKADFSTEPVAAAPLSRKFFAQPSNSEGKKPLRLCWKFGDGKEECKEYTTLSTGPFVADHTYATAGQYEACLTIKYDGGCEAKMCKLITVTNPPPPPPPANCEMKFSEMASSVTTFKRTFIASVMSNRSAEKICWTFGDGKDNCTQLSNPATQQSLTATHEYAAPGVYRVCAKVSYAGGCTADFCKEVVIKANNKTCGGEMSVAVTDGKTATFEGHGTANAAGHVTSYRWNFGDGTTGTGEKIKHTYTTSGNYEV
jgi:PKD repeat protein